MPFQEIYVTWTQWLPHLQSKIVEKSKDTGIWRTLGLDVVHEADHYFQTADPLLVASMLLKAMQPISVEKTMSGASDVEESRRNRHASKLLMELNMISFRVFFSFLSTLSRGTDLLYWSPPFNQYLMGEVSAFLHSITISIDPRTISTCAYTENNEVSLIFKS